MVWMQQKWEKASAVEAAELWVSHLRSSLASLFSTVFSWNMMHEHIKIALCVNKIGYSNIS